MERNLDSGPGTKLISPEPRKALSPIISTASGTLTSSSDSHPAKAPVPMTRSDEGNDTEANDRQPENRTFVGCGDFGTIKFFTDFTQWYDFTVLVENNVLPII